ncbi:Peptidase family M23 [Microbacterium sp. ru370.1]|uniref:murein hydrolase activator EnvC family protein n=1 Tax=unclassified Microbacterium TaxID=2609290 RepID=UPI000889A60A|nr:MULTISPECIES: M23 family metallopeptidase [unclassified Microbacterium]SDO80406.1 Peptidase family M23 [Microbacterium sp. ru370.1]SIT89627.1 Peptidase family M23 [Microbacterium sp. RU1D]
MIAKRSARLLARASAVLTLCGLLVGAAAPPGGTVGQPLAQKAASPGSTVGLFLARKAVSPGGSVGDSLAQRGWTWPTSPVRILRAYAAPAHPYGPGHRGIDLAGTEVRAPAEGVVAFVGTVAGRGVLTIDHGAGLVSSYEPVVSDLAVGAHVARGEPLATVTEGGHTAPASVHLGVRLDGEYINPLRLLGGVPRAVLLPCC